MKLVDLIAQSIRPDEGTAPLQKNLVHSPSFLWKNTLEDFRYILQALGSAQNSLTTAIHGIPPALAPSYKVLFLLERASYRWLYFALNRDCFILFYIE